MTALDRKGRTKEARDADKAIQKARVSDFGKKARLYDLLVLGCGCALLAMGGHPAFSLQRVD